jgi:very-short-patch-repair endonuclease/NAD(P)-dependent dehydrogenase (short-subunit alcohol dehydrogenase family)
MKKVVYITGCLGFIGSYVTRKCLDRGWYVKGIDKLTYAANKDLLNEFKTYSNFSFVHCDINDLKFLYDCDYVINTAAETHVGNSIVSSVEFVKSNIDGVHNLLELIKNHRGENAKKPTLIHFSTDEVYGDISEGAHEETDMLKPSNPYSATKAAADMLVMAWGRTHNIPYMIIRPTNNYGIGQYVEKLAWRFQHSRTGLKENQALTGWQQLQSKITKSGKGKRDVHVKREARKTLKDCKNAVPVWIMPLSRVFDSFDLVQTKFDVILLDEASQSDITALVAFAIAKQVIVVGDKEQVTPYAVGQELGKIQSLIDELLQGVPNRMLYDGKTSIYDLAEQAFGERIRLEEHFRCVPDIIEFSNRLSYSGKIRPLRESASSPYVNHLVAHRISGATSHNKINQKEALEVASIVAAMSEMEEYSSASIGIISLVGQDQAIVIDSILQRRLTASTYSKHNLLCGNASQFQGDERDVVIISMVDTCEAPPLSISQNEDFKKTFNVAASRSRNQLWVVHSLNPDTDLKPGDLRLRLIQHAENPKALKQAVEATQKRADPKSVVFEPMVIRDLMHVGFRVVPQFEVGAYTIDMIVEGSSKRVAIECDGDRYHPPEKLSDDIQRQMVLERLGWTFIRIRGSEYFRNKESAIKRVIAELESMGIEKLGPKTSEATVEVADELRRKVLQRATEIRLEWKSSEEPEVAVKVKKGRWG